MDPRRTSGGATCWRSLAAYAGFSRREVTAGFRLSVAIRLISGPATFLNSVGG